MPKHPAARSGFFWHGTWVHAISLTLLFGLAVMLVDFKKLSELTLFGIGGQWWFLLTLLIPAVHQVFVWLAWRSELCFGGVSRLLGRWAFVIYQITFFVLFLARPLSFICLAVVDHDSIALSVPMRIIFGVVLGLPTVYTGYSVVRFFGLLRAAGADHFDEHYRDLPLVKDGIFKYSSNSMYTFGFLVFWLIAILAASWSGLVAAAFSHAYIWVHYFCTERPDMQIIYATSHGDPSS